MARDGTHHDRDHGDYSGYPPVAECQSRWERSQWGRCESQCLPVVTNTSSGCNSGSQRLGPHQFPFTSDSSADSEYHDPVIQVLPSKPTREAVARHWPRQLDQEFNFAVSESSLAQAGGLRAAAAGLVRTSFYPSLWTLISDLKLDSDSPVSAPGVFDQTLATQRRAHRDGYQDPNPPHHPCKARTRLPVVSGGLEVPVVASDAFRQQHADAEVTLSRSPYTHTGSSALDLHLAALARAPAGASSTTGCASDLGWLSTSLSPSLGENHSQSAPGLASADPAQAGVSLAMPSTLAVSGLGADPFSMDWMPWSRLPCAIGCSGLGEGHEGGVEGRQLCF